MSPKSAGGGAQKMRPCSIPESTESGARRRLDSPEPRISAPPPQKRFSCTHARPSPSLGRPGPARLLGGPPVDFEAKFSDIRIWPSKETPGAGPPRALKDCTSCAPGRCPTISAPVPERLLTLGTCRGSPEMWPESAPQSSDSEEDRCNWHQVVPAAPNFASFPSQ